MNEAEKQLLAQFHHTISEQLNARLSESPKFFGLLVVVSTAYGYVLATDELKPLLALASLLAYISVLWASWYLAALGYAFRFLQYSQHKIERTLQWNPQYVPGPEDGRATGEPPLGEHFFDRFWLLPGIYHAHAAGLAVLLMLICMGFCSRGWSNWATCQLRSVAVGVGLAMALLGLYAISWINLHYFEKFKKKALLPDRSAGQTPEK